MTSLRAERLFAAGQRLADAWDHEGALAAYENAIALAPEHARIRLHEAAALSALGRYREAVAEAERAKELDPRNEVADAFLAVIRYDNGDMAAAVEAADNALERVPGNMQIAGLKGLALLASGEESGRDLVGRTLAAMSDAVRARVLAWCVGGHVPALEDGAARAEIEAELVLLATVLDLSAAAFGGRAGFPDDYVPLTVAGPAPSDADWYAQQMDRFEQLRDSRMELLEFHASEPYDEDPAAIGISPRMRAYVAVLMRAFGRAADARAWAEASMAEDEAAYVPHYLLGVLAVEDGDGEAARRHLTECLRRCSGRLALDVWAATTA